MYQRATACVILGGILGIAGMFVGWFFLDAAVVDLLAVGLLVLAGHVNQGRRPAVTAALVLAVLSAAAHLVGLGIMLFAPQSVLVNGQPIRPLARIGMSAWFVLMTGWMLTTAWWLSRCRQQAGRAGRPGMA